MQLINTSRILHFITYLQYCQYAVDICISHILEPFLQYCQYVVDQHILENLLAQLLTKSVKPLL